MQGPTYLFLMLSATSYGLPQRRSGETPLNTFLRAEFHMSIASRGSNVVRCTCIYIKSITDITFFATSNTKLTS